MDKDLVVSMYDEYHSMRRVASLLGCSLQTVRHIMIDAGAYTNDTCKAVQDLCEQGLSVHAIADKLQVSTSTVYTYLPYTKGVYNAVNPTTNALRIRKHRARQQKTSTTDQGGQHDS